MCVSFSSFPVLGPVENLQPGTLHHSLALLSFFSTLNYSFSLLHGVVDPLFCSWSMSTVWTAKPTGLGKLMVCPWCDPHPSYCLALRFLHTQAFSVHAQMF